MKKSTEDLIDQIGDRVFVMPIGILWKSQNMTPGVGERKSVSRGSDGYEIASRQPYEVGDDPRSIDHFATAQSGDDSILTISFEEPQDIKIVTIVDVGPRMQFGTRRADKRTVSAEITASILACVTKTQDAAIVATVSEHQIESSIGPRGAKSIFSSALESILEPQLRVSKEDGEGFLTDNPISRTWKKLSALKAFAATSSASATGSTNRGTSGLCEALNALPRSRSLVFVLSDFVALSVTEKEALSDAAAVHDLVCIVIQDLRERELPEGRGIYTLRDIVSGGAKTVWLNDTNRDLFRRNAEQRLDRLAAFFKDADCDWGLFSTEQTAEQVIPEMMRLFGGHRR